jgi:hypothetical protein
LTLCKDENTLIHMDVKWSWSNFDFVFSDTPIITRELLGDKFFNKIKNNSQLMWNFEKYCNMRLQDFQKWENFIPNITIDAWKHRFDQEPTFIDMNDNESYKHHFPWLNIQRYEEVSKRISDKYNIKLYQTSNPNYINNSNDFMAYIEALEKSLDRLPKILLDSINLNSIVLYQDLRNVDWVVDNQSPWIIRLNMYWQFGFEKYSQGNKFLLEDVSWTLTHEIFHLLDTLDNFLQDNVWPFKKTKYLGDWFNKLDPTYIPDWCVSVYSIKSADEDQAEIFMTLFNNPEMIFSLCKNTTNSILRDKVEMITGCRFDQKVWKFWWKLNLEDYKKRFWTDNYLFFAKLLPSIDHNFWNNIPRINS